MCRATGKRTPWHDNGDLGVNALEDEVAVAQSLPGQIAEPLVHRQAEECRAEGDQHQRDLHHRHRKVVIHHEDMRLISRGPLTAPTV